MAGAFSYQYRSLILDYAVGNVIWTPPATLFVAIYTASPGPGDLGTEAIMDAGRISQPNDLTAWNNAVNGVKNNLLALDVPPQSLALGTIVSIGWRDKDVDPSMLCFSCDLVTPIPMIAGSALHFDAGDFTINWSQ
jgi:hypothetical protein